MIICPNCHQELTHDEYYETTDYHNSIIGHCKKCGHDAHWGDFFKKKLKHLGYLRYFSYLCNMTLKEINRILKTYKFFGFTVKRSSDNQRLTYTYHSIPYFAVNVIVDTIRLDKDKIVTKVQIGDITITDEKNLLPTLNNIYKIHKRILYGNKTP